MITIGSVFLALTLSAPPAIVGLEKVPETHRAHITDYVKTHPVVGSAVVSGVQAGNEDTDKGTWTRSTVLLEETAGSGGGCRFRLHRIEHDSFAEKGGLTTTEGSSGEVGSDCCALVNDFPCDRTDLDWLLHYERARSAKDGKALAKLVFRSFFLKAAWAEDGKHKTKTTKITAADLAKGKGIQALPAVDALHMTVSCNPPDKDGAFACSASQGGNHVTFSWKNVGDKTKTKFETKLVGISTEED